MNTITRHKKILFLLMLIGFASCNSNKKIISSLQDKPLEATGNEKDWGEANTYDSKSKFWYKISNDNNNMYIMLKMDDEALKRKALMFGLTLWIDTTDHQKEKLGIRFPKGRDKGTRQESRERPSNDTERNPGQMKDRLLEELQVIELMGFDNRESNVMMIGESKIRPVLAFDTYNTLIYQCVLPLKFVFKNMSSPKVISMGFTTGSMERPTSTEGGEGMREDGMQGGMPGGGGQMGGGQRGGMGRGVGNGRPGGGMRNDQETSGPSRFWFKHYCLNCRNQVH